MKIETLKIPGYKKVVAVKDKASDLHAFIAVHSTVLGPSLGGVRMFPYSSERKALEDALRLAKAMTYKASISGLNLGGGKAVIIGDPQKNKSRKMFLALGELIGSLGGIYLAAEDSGIKPEDLDIVSERTCYLTGTTHEHGSGDPSPATAAGILKGIQACLIEKTGNDQIKDRTVAIQGVGQVGFNLAKLLQKAGAKLILTDVCEERLCQAAKLLNAGIVAPAEIHRLQVDIFAPCALGGVLNAKTIPQIKAPIVAGGANNQFQDEKKHAPLLFKKGILHAPDYVINAGGLIQLYVKEILKKDDITPWIDRIGETMGKIFSISKKKGIPPLLVAHQIAEERIKKKKASGR